MSLHDMSSHVLMKINIRHSDIQFKNDKNPESTPLQLPALFHPSVCVCDKDIKSPSFSWNLRWGDTLSRDQGSDSSAIYNGGWVVLKCSANYHLCIFGLGLRGLWVLWAACQRWNRKEKCSWKRMRRLRARDLWNSSMQMKCTLHPGLFFPSIFSISRRKEKKKVLAHNLRCVLEAMCLNCWRETYVLHAAALSWNITSSSLKERNLHYSHFKSQLKMQKKSQCDTKMVQKHKKEQHPGQILHSFWG